MTNSYEEMQETSLLYILSSSYNLRDRLKMVGGWALKMAKWGHFLQILSMKSSFLLKVGKAKAVCAFFTHIIYINHITKNTADLIIYFSFDRKHAQ